MSLDVYLKAVRETEVFEANITHNLVQMADACGLYKAIWHPDDVGIHTAWQLIPYLEAGLERLKSDPDKYSFYNPTNGWGSYKDFIPWVEKYLDACRANPDAKVEAHG